MKKLMTLYAISAAALALAGCASMGMDDAQSSNSDSMEVVTVGGAEMYPTKNIIENAVNSPIHTNLVAAVKAAGLVETLSGPGPFTVFAPTDEAFAGLPAGTVDTLMKPENKALLTKVLTYHVVPGRITASDIAMKIKRGNGKAVFTTVAGEKLTAVMVDGNVQLQGVRGSAYVTQADVMQSNGVIHVINGIVLPQ